MMTAYDTTGADHRHGSAATMILGLGQTGYACARFLYDAGIEFAAADTRCEPPLGPRLRQEMPEVQVHAGGLEVGMFAACRELVVSPGIDPRLPLLQVLRQKGLQLISEIDLFQRHCQAPVAAVTGTNGKSTVVSMLAAMAQEAGLDAAAGGNLGPPAIALLHPGRQLYLLELSSFQLQLMGDVPLAAACVLNISPDHVDRHGGMEQYRASKARIYAAAKRSVVNLDDPAVTAMAAADAWGFTLRQPQGERQFGLHSVDGIMWLLRGRQKLVRRDRLPLPGRHNSANYLAALAMGTALELPLAAMGKALRCFRGLPHRTEMVAEQDSVRWINDSKATNSGAAAAAVRGLATGLNLVLIAGGQAKDDDFSQLVEAVAGRVCNVVLLGEDVSALEAALKGCVPLSRAGDMRQAVGMAAAFAKPGYTVLFSPGGASFDMYHDYCARGEDYVAAVQEYMAGAD